MKENISKEKFTKLYQKELDNIFRYCLFRVSNRENAIEISQETFMRFWDALVQKKEIHNDKAFLFMIARNLVIDFYRKKKSVSLDAIMDNDENETFMIGEENAKENIELSAEARFVLDKISEMESSNQQIIYLRFVEGLDLKNIYKIMNLSANAVSVRINRGLKKLRQITGYNN
jgi:RNA polymerase sigma-70 factor (ECF subfamily)